MVLRASEVSAAPGPLSPEGGPPANGSHHGGQNGLVEVDRATAVVAPPEPRLRVGFRYMRRNPRLVAGFGILLFLLLFWLIGSQAMNTTARARPLSGPPDM